MKKLIAFGGSLVLALATLSAVSIGGEKKGPNTDPKPAEAKETASTKGMSGLATANQLIQYGRQEKHAESLLVAAQILNNLQTKALGVEKVASEIKDKKAAKETDNSPKALVAEALKLSSAAHVVALADATKKLLEEGTRGATGGLKVDSFVIQPGQVVNWNPITFNAGERAEVYIDCGVTSRMTLQVFDDLGNLITQDSVPGNYYRVVWVPRWTGPFRIRLTNNDTGAFRCGMATN